MSSQGFQQVQKQSQSLVLAPQLQHSLKILQAPAVELRSSILAELQANPLLEELAVDHPTTCCRLQLLGRRLHAHRDITFGCGMSQAIHNGLGVIGRWEHATVCFGVKAHPSRFEPLDGILGLELIKGFFEGFTASRVAFGQAAGGEGRIGNIASTATTDFYLGQNFVRLLEQRNGRIRMMLPNG